MHKKFENRTKQNREKIKGFGLQKIKKQKKSYLMIQYKPKMQRKVQKIFAVQELRKQTCTHGAFCNAKSPSC